MKKVYALTDYQNRFLPKIGDKPLKSGMDKSLLKNYFLQHNIEIDYIPLSDIDFVNDDFKDKIVLINSSEEYKGYYKSYIEDVVLSLKLQGAILIPKYEFLRSHHNKSFMEILRKTYKEKEINSLVSYSIGTYEDFLRILPTIENSKWVIKRTDGAGSSGVVLANDKSDLQNKAKKMMRSFSFIAFLVNLKRKFLDKNYNKMSHHQKKIIIQEFIPNLKNDWKVLIYGHRYYVLTRYVRKNDFRSSGSGNFTYEKDIPKELLIYSKKIYDIFNVPDLSLDICFDGEAYYLIEFQAIYYGTYTLVNSPFYFKYENNSFELIKEKSVLEEVYAESIVKYLEDE